MSVRVLFAAVVAVALLASAMPAVEEAQQARVGNELDGSAERLETTMTGLVRHSDPVPPGVPGARRVVRIDIPDRSPDARLTIRTGTPKRLDSGSDATEPGVEGIELWSKGIDLVADATDSGAGTIGYGADTTGYGADATGPGERVTAAGADPTRLSYTVGDRGPNTRWVNASVRIVRDGVLAPPGASLVITSDTPLTLGYHRVNGTPTVTVTRGFKPGNPTSHDYVRSPD